MKRGVSLLLGFFVILAIAGFLGLGAVAFFLPVVWLYAFFDSYNLRSRILDGTAPQDEYLFGWTASAWQSCCAAATASSVGDW